ncbi:NfeD family protein [Estrella lausannensis]|uniref:Conserved putative membrane protein n=1 Tax=Estrella lausannensis TaxID=483423 RepID=A0A0H5DRX4_9BACT|nr:NfeD family protein [Estrella lausannensis]CRX39382.1 Conserved putative membrane protein [Estrella lausannensis]
MGEALLLLFLGLISVAIEFFTPGGFFAVIGATLIITASVYAAVGTGSMLTGFLFFIISGALVLLLVFTMMRWLRQGRFRHSIYSSQNQEGFVASSWDKSLVGKKGLVATELRPGGHVRIEGKQYPAISQSGLMERGEAVEVIGGEGDTLLVKKV